MDGRVTTGAQGAQVKNNNRSTPAARYTPPCKMRC
ncbi:hypothetical protein ECA0157_09968 [Escherichia coli ECA-0157]|nr:hypothetical protein ECA0157_09968 [Escherichia coli ECA-0157]